MEALFTWLLILILVLCDNLVVIEATKYPYVTCGSVVKLVNKNFQVRLHSHDVKYGSGSGQQSVTGTSERDDVNSYWAVKGIPGEACKRGEPVACGSKIRLEHIVTKRNLHSHLFKSPLSGNQEISAFGENGEGDSGDNWTIVCNDDFWERESAFRLKHKDTETWLGVSGRTYGRPIHGQAEVVAASYPDSSSYWQTSEGVIVKPTEIRDFSNTIRDEL